MRLNVTIICGVLALGMGFFTSQRAQACMGGFTLSECISFGNRAFDCYMSGCRNPDLTQLDADRPEPGIHILESLPSGGPSTVALNTTTPQGTFMDYLHSNVIQWVVWVCIGIGTLWVVICGGMIAAYGGNSGERAKWVSRIISAIIGIVLLFATSGILRFLNDIFFAV